MKRYNKLNKKSFKESYYENDLSHLGNRELDKLGKLLIMYGDRKLTNNAHKHLGKVEKFGFNSSSDNIFLIDDNENVLMENHGKLDIFLSLPYGGEEGFPDDFDGRTEDEFEQDDVEFLQNFGEFKNGKYKAHT